MNFLVLAIAFSYLTTFPPKAQRLTPLAWPSLVTGNERSQLRPVVAARHDYFLATAEQDVPQTCSNAGARSGGEAQS